MCWSQSDYESTIFDHTYLFEAFDPVLHIEDFELLTLFAGEARSGGDKVLRWFKKLGFVGCFITYNRDYISLSIQYKYIRGVIEASAMIIQAPFESFSYRI